MARDLVHGPGRLVLVRPLRPADADTIARDAGRPPAASSAGPSTAAGPGHRPQSPRPSGAEHPAGAAHPPDAAHPQSPRPQGGHPGTPGRTPRLCLVAYQGTFRADAIAGAQPAGATGTYAMIFLWVRHPAVDRILITDVLPASSRRPWWHF
jgi:hypothetical protein